MLSRRRLLLAGLAACAGGYAPAQGPAKTDPPANKKPDPPTGRPLTLGECLAIGAERQPDIRAAQHSLRAAELGLQGLSGLGRVADWFSPDLPIRRQQSALGLRVAQAQVDQARQETTYDVTLFYWSVVYARQSEQTAFDVIEQLESYYRLAEDLLNAGGVPGGKLNRQSLYVLQAGIAEVRVLRLRAETGRRQALAALRQAMGVGPEFDFHPAATELPVMGGSVTEADVVRWARDRRPELAQAAAGVDVFNLEPCAQAAVKLRPQVNTLAAGTDLHARTVPVALRNGQYRPGALAPEMPISMVGRTADRVARAAEYAARMQGPVYDKSVNLVVLEAQTAFIEWDAATTKVGLTKRRFDATQQAKQEAITAATARADPQLLINAEAVAGKAQADYVEAVFEQVKALAKLERVTAGAVRPDFPGR